MPACVLSCLSQAVLSRNLIKRPTAFFEKVKKKGRHQDLAELLHSHTSNARQRTRATGVRTFGLKMQRARSVPLSVSQSPKQHPVYPLLERQKLVGFFDIQCEQDGSAVVRAGQFKSRGSGSRRAREKELLSLLRKPFRCTRRLGTLSLSVGRRFKRTSDYPLGRPATRVSVRPR